MCTSECGSPDASSLQAHLPHQVPESTPWRPSVEMLRRKQSSTLISLPGLPAHALKPPRPFFFIFSYSMISVVVGSLQPSDSRW